MRWGKHNHFSIETAKERFATRNAVRKNGCIEWTGAMQKSGYGILSLAGRFWLAHRAAWFLHTGIDPKGMCVCHRCDNPRCVNVEHLFLGSQEDNVRDMETKNRSVHPIGEQHGRAKLSKKDVIQIRKLFIEGMAKRAIARLFPIVSRTSVIAVINNKSWIE